MDKDKQLAFVLGGGGARGALQVGALQALLEADIHPNMLVGTSIGAVNATYLALHGFDQLGLDGLVAAWHDAAQADLLPSNYLWLTVRSLFKRPSSYSSHRMRDFFIAHGLQPHHRFAEINDFRLILVAADLNSGGPVLYGQDPQDSLLEGLLASTSLPPWVPLVEQGGRLLIDGGVVSNLPIEPAMACGASEIFALDLFDPRSVQSQSHNFPTFLNKFLCTVEQRQIELELNLAAVRGVVVHRIMLQAPMLIPVWDFRHTTELIALGYEITRQEIARSGLARKRSWREWLPRFAHKIISPFNKG